MAITETQKQDLILSIETVLRVLNKTEASDIDYFKLQATHEGQEVHFSDLAPDYSYCFTGWTSVDIGFRLRQRDNDDKT